MTDRVLITGGAGFCGRHLVRYLLRETDWELTVLDRLAEGSNLPELQDERIDFWWHDLRAEIRPPLGSFRYVIHLAAQSHVDRSVRDPLKFVADNVLGTAHLLEYARGLHSLEKFLHFSTDEVFGAAQNGESFDEYDSFHATNPYSASKAAAEALAPAWASTYGLPILVTRCTNVAGPGQDGEKFIPNSIAKIRRDETVQIHSRDGVPSSRKYIDVEDVCSAVLVVLRKAGCIAGRGTGFVNIGGELEHSNLDVANAIAALMGRQLRYELVEDPPNRPRPDMRYDLDNSRLKALGWQQRVTLEETLKRCVQG